MGIRLEQRHVAQEYPTTLTSTMEHMHPMSKGRRMACIEIEHAEMFARTFLGRRPGRRPGKPGDHVDGIQSMDDFSRGYLHIYWTTPPLTNLVYIGGTSAGKITMGTLDTEDYILCNMTDGDDRQRPL
ncbi:hypothetical protein DL98DRAFT_661707 [Cadophora sp. DSE1049]|nr:hypothetical protein DL98DRAFT_661707 [Cadophora sp. DSE1049]